MKYIMLIIINIVLNIVVSAQETDLEIEKKIWENKIYKDGIETVLLYRTGWELSMPVIELNSEDKLTLQFDEINKSHNTYTYTVIHCSSNWQQSDIDPMEYISGQLVGRIDQHNFSQNTMVNYVNYSVDFPNEDIKFLVSGNYVLKVFEDDDPEKLILTRRFYVYEPLIEISANIERLKIVKEEGENQRLSFSLKCDENEIENPFETLTYKILKNNETEKDYTTLKPSSINGNILVFNNNDALACAGGNEYRHFDLKSFKYLSDGLQKIDKQSDTYYVLLKTDQERENDDYKIENDLNGRKLIKLENNDKSNIMADYCFVDFNLNTPIPFEKGDYYIFGSISDWKIDERFKMVYNPQTDQFEKRIFLKQGYYNYMYLFISDDKFYNSETHKYKIEGNHFQTENEYQILVYNKPYNKNYQRLVGYSVVNSFK